MEQVIQVTGLCVVGALLALVVKRGSPETALLLAVGAAVVVALALAGVVKELLAFLGELGSASGVSADLFVPLYKTSASPWWCRWEATSAGTRGRAPWPPWWRRRGPSAPCWRPCRCCGRCWTCCWS